MVKTVEIKQIMDYVVEEYVAEIIGENCNFDVEEETTPEGYIKSSTIYNGYKIEIIEFRTGRCDLIVWKMEV